MIVDGAIVTAVTATPLICDDFSRQLSGRFERLLVCCEYGLLLWYPWPGLSLSTRYKWIVVTSWGQKHQAGGPASFGLHITSA